LIFISTLQRNIYKKLYLKGVIHPILVTITRSSLHFPSQ